MIYEIQSKSDISIGATLVVKIPEEELDKNALYTIVVDKPDFILPFRHRIIDGEVEFVYQIGMNSKLQYLSGRRAPQEYAQMWASVLNPLLDCDDWYMNPFSFVLSLEHLYYDKNAKAVNYVYIPSKKAVADYDALKSMAVEISKQITVADANLENKILWSIVSEFNPKDFLQLLKPYESPGGAAAVMHEPIHHHHEPVAQPSIPSAPPPPTAPPPMAPPPMAPPQSMPQQPAAGGYAVQSPSPAHGLPGDIVINIPAKEKGKKEKPPKKQFGGEKKNEPKPEPQPKPQKQKGGLLGGKKKDAQAQIIMGAAATPLMPAPPPIMHPPEGMQGNMPPMMYDPHMESDATQILDSNPADAIGLRLISNLNLPQRISVQAGIGRPFSIGRFDTRIGAKQSDFEFPNGTKAVSRRHAVIERTQDGYFIVDLGSSAGTYVNNIKIIPNSLHPLAAGDRVSFGNAGADYVWET